MRVAMLRSQELDGLDIEIVPTSPDDRFMSRLLVSITSLAVALFAPTAHASDELDESLFSFSSFGTLGVVHSSEDQADFTSTTFKPDGAGYTHAWSPAVDSLVGAQLTAHLTPQLSAVVQVISEQNADGSYRPHVEWANIKYQFGTDVSIRFGRTVMPAFLLTESRKLGYAYPWVRPPLEGYRVLPVTNNDGADISYRLHAGNLFSTFQANAGRNNLESPHGGVGLARRSWGVSYTAEFGALTARITYQTTHLTFVAFNDLFDGFRQFGPQGIALADTYDIEDKAVPIVAVGVSYDPGQWFAMAEWGAGDTHSVIGAPTGWYVSGGYRFGALTPYLTFAKGGADNLSDPGLTVSALPPSLRGPATGLNAALNAILSSKVVQNTATIGARWDFAKHFDLKLQFDHTNIGAGSTGSFINTQPGYQLGGKVNLFSATIDFVF
jgi:hypothetical protein